MFTAEHADKLIHLKQFLRIIVKIGHHSLGRLAGREFRQGMDTDLIDLRIGLFLVKLHVSRGIDYCHRPGSGANSVRNGPLV